MGYQHGHLCGSNRFGLNWDQFEDAERIYLTVGKSPFTARLASEILKKEIHKFSPTIAVYKNNKVCCHDHDVSRSNGGRKIAWYRFTEQWCYWYETRYLKSKTAAKDTRDTGGENGVKVHAE